MGSPFDYAAHARLFVPRGFPKPNEPGHPPAVARPRRRAAPRALGGRTFVLTTTLRALQPIARGAARRLDARRATASRCWCRAARPKRALLQRFLDAPRPVLVGSQSFWEGIDVPGDALQCVLIDKLPFPPPNDPLVEARVQRARSARAATPFNDYFVAEAAVSLKQGAGRLIRSETDRGLLVVCDPRMAAHGLRPAPARALPPMTRAERRGARRWPGWTTLAAAPLERLSRLLTRAATRRACCRRPGLVHECGCSGKFCLQHAVGVVAQLRRGRAGRSSAP